MRLGNSSAVQEERLAGASGQHACAASHQDNDARKQELLQPLSTNSTVRQQNIIDNTNHVKPAGISRRHACTAACQDKDSYSHDLCQLLSQLHSIIIPKQSTFGKDAVHVEPANRQAEVSSTATEPTALPVFQQRRAVNTSRDNATHIQPAGTAGQHACTAACQDMVEHQHDLLKLLEQNTSSKDALHVEPAKRQGEITNTNVVQLEHKATEPTALPVTQQRSAVHQLQGPSVRIIYSGLSSMSKGILENLIKGWTQWHARNTDQADGAEAGEWTYAAILADGTDQPLFWSDKPVATTHQVEQAASVPLYDRCTDHVLAGTLTGTKRRRESFQRCFNCGSYDHELSACSRPFNRAVVEGNRQAHASTKSQSTPINRKLRYHSEGAGEVITATAFKFEGLQAGVLSPTLREALGLQDLDPPPWLARMRMLGLPPGYDDTGEASDANKAAASAVDEQHDAPSEGDDFISLESTPIEQIKPALRVVRLPGVNAPIPLGADVHTWAQAGAVILTQEEPEAKLAIATPQPASESQATVHQPSTVLDEAEDVDMEVEEEIFEQENHQHHQLAQEQQDSQPAGKASSLLLEGDDVDMDVVDTSNQRPCDAEESLEPPGTCNEPTEPIARSAEAEVVEATNAEPNNAGNAGSPQDTNSPRSSIEHDALAADMPAVAQQQARAAFWRVLPQLHTSTRGVIEQPSTNVQTQHADHSQPVEHEDPNQESYIPLSPHSYIPLSPQTPNDAPDWLEAEQPDVAEQTRHVGNNVVDAKPSETGGRHALPPSDPVPSLLPSLDVCPVDVANITSVPDRDESMRSRLDGEARTSARLHSTYTGDSRRERSEPRRERARVEPRREHTCARDESISPYQERRVKRMRANHDAREEQLRLASPSSPPGYEYYRISDRAQETLYDLPASHEPAPYFSRREATYHHRESVIRSPHEDGHTLVSPRMRNTQDNDTYYGYHAPRRRDDINISSRDRRERSSRSRSRNRSPFQDNCSPVPQNCSPIPHNLSPSHAQYRRQHSNGSNSR